MKTLEPIRHNKLFEYELGEKELKLNFLRSKCVGAQVKKLVARDDCREYVIAPKKL